MPFSLVAQLPLGTYRGHRPDRTVERFPSVARLHAALLCAAGFGPRAVETDGSWEPCPADAAALRWLEENPPTEVRIPALQVSRNDAVAYRDDGTIGKARGAKTIRRLPKQEGVVAVDGPFVWSWREPPPESVVEVLRELCPDVAHLGTAESPVLLSTSDEEFVVTHRHAPGCGPFDRTAGVGVDLPAPGRLDELDAAHRAERTGRVGSDRAGTDERSVSPVPPRQAIRAARYGAVTRSVGDVPWPRVLLVPLDAPVRSERDRVRWAVAAHKAMIKILDRDSPPVLTGAYPEGTRRPPNRVALHFVDSTQAVDLPAGAPAALAVLLPPDAPSAELDAVYRAVGQLRDLHVRRRGDLAVRRVIGPVEVVDGDRFWREPGPGRVRLWRTSPPAVPDTRGHHGWTFVHAALLSVGFVWQGSGVPRPTGRGVVRDTAVVDSVNAAGVAVVEVDPVRHSRVEDYVHHVHPHAVVRPYTATVSLGDLGGPSTIQAIGQSRHLGGGLLVPEDHLEGSVLS